MGGFLILVSLVAIVVAIIAFARAGIPQLRIANRKQAVALGVVGFVVMLIGGAVAGQTEKVPVAQPSPRPSVRPSPSPSPSPEPSPSPSPSPPPPPPPSPKPSPKPPAPSPTKVQTANCHASYPDFCIPPPPPDLNCGDPEIGGRKNFTVRWDVPDPDPHKFDRDKDGVGCES